MARIALDLIEYLSDDVLLALEDLEERVLAVQQQPGDLHVFIASACALEDL
jgi:hypothetical protein